jgi:hypothetical protein
LLVPSQQTTIFFAITNLLAAARIIALALCPQRTRLIASVVVA